MESESSVELYSSWDRSGTTNNIRNGVIMESGIRNGVHSKWHLKRNPESYDKWNSTFHQHGIGIEPQMNPKSGTETIQD